MSKTAYLVLENGKVFQGKTFGAEGEITAEVVFTTGMTGYLETLTDKSYHGQMVVQTFPLIGNYGVIPSDFEGTINGPCAYIVKSWCQNPSNFRSEGDIDTFLKEKGIIGLYDIDTRALTKIIRESGVMNGKIVYDLADVDWKEIRDYRITGAVESVTAAKGYHVAATGFDGKISDQKVEGRFHVALWDFGLKENIVRELAAHGCNVTVFPGNSTAQDIIAAKPDGIMLSNGPGDPEENVEIISNLNHLLSSGIPIFGICLGHQLLALANGFKTYKLKYGHRGCNQPVKDLKTGRICITSQNHGYAVDSASIDKAIADLRFVNVNDSTCEGIEYLKYPAFSVQYHPEGCAGPKDSELLFKQFVKMMQEKIGGQYAVK